jgi:hypothetical protein
MRRLCLLLVVIGMPLHASAQEQRRAGNPPPSLVGSTGLPLPSIGLPPAKALPTATPRTRPWDGRQIIPSWERPRVPAWERQGPPPWERGHVSQPIYPAKPVKPDHDRRRRSKADVVFVPYPAYGYGYSYGYGSGLPYYTGSVTVGTPAAAPEPPPPPSDTGYLRLEVEPASLLQIYVDGVYIGTPADINGDLELRSGAHRIELRAPGYDSLTFDARIEADRGITYRSTLRAIDARPVAPSAPIAVPTGSKTLYVIPGCYLGNVLPDATRLPVGCDISRMKTHTP